MATLPPPTPAWWAGRVLTTTPPAAKVAKGYIVTRPAGAVVVDVPGVPTDATVPPGTTIAQDSTTGRLYRYDAGSWRPVAGTPEG